MQKLYFSKPIIQNTLISRQIYQIDFQSVDFHNYFQQLHIILHTLRFYFIPYPHLTKVHELVAEPPLTFADIFTFKLSQMANTLFNRHVGYIRSKTNINFNLIYCINQIQLSSLPFRREYCKGIYKQVDQTKLSARDLRYIWKSLFFEELQTFLFTLTFTLKFTLKLTLKFILKFTLTFTLKFTQKFSPKFTLKFTLIFTLIFIPILTLIFSLILSVVFILIFIRLNIKIFILPHVRNNKASLDFIHTQYAIS